jgi:hypothetical protein
MDLFLAFLPLFIGLFFFFLTLYKDSSILRVKFSFIQNFITIMVLLTVFRLWLISVKFNIFDIPPIISGVLQGIDVQFPFVFWEDACFVLPIFLFRRYISDKKKFWIPLMILSSILFANGHLYQGIYVAALTGIYPYFISYRYGSKYGFGSIMVAHILYDFITFYTIKIAPYLII